MRTIKTIKIIDLLNKIVNEEEVPKKIKYGKDIFMYDTNMKDYIHKIDENGFIREALLYRVMVTHFIKDLLQTKVEIIEDSEEKKIEKIETVKNVKGETCIKLYENGDSNVLSVQNIRIIDKINELVEEVNKLKNN